ncbi:MAG: A24 family peptidase [Clostridiales bacterium]|jgi:prepilin signal peptidase PulO-like enzyme (type II secretory pathway)|nr:A24 family peptidase [Clostridiales bacterium]
MLEILIDILIFIILFMISLIDIKTFIIHDKSIVLLLFLIILKLLFRKDIDIRDMIFGSLIVSLPMFILTKLIKKSFGAGDIKLFFITGLFLGFRKNLLTFMISVISASIFSCILIILGLKNKNDTIPFAPFIVLGTLLAKISNR